MTLGAFIRSMAPVLAFGTMKLSKYAHSEGGEQGISEDKLLGAPDAQKGPSLFLDLKNGHGPLFFDYDPETGLSYRGNSSLDNCVRCSQQVEPHAARRPRDIYVPDNELSLVNCDDAYARVVTIFANSYLTQTGQKVASPYYNAAVYTKVDGNFECLGSLGTLSKEERAEINNFQGCRPSRWTFARVATVIANPGQRDLCQEFFDFKKATVQREEEMLGVMCN